MTQAPTKAATKAAAPAAKDAPVELPTSFKWSEAVMVRTGGFQTKPVPEWALEAVKEGYARTQTGVEKPALTSEVASEAQGKAVLNQLRRAAKQMGYGLRGNVQGPHDGLAASVTFQATDPIKGKAASNGEAPAAS